MVSGTTCLESLSGDLCTYVVFEHVVSFAIKETRNFGIGDDTTETSGTAPS